MKRKNKTNVDDPYIGLTPIPRYILTEKVGEGKIGYVYRAYNEYLQDSYACKIIPEERLKDGWIRELEKLVRLRGVPNIVPYHQHGSCHDHNNRPFTFVIFDFIKGKNLKDLIADSSSTIDMAFIENMATTLLSVLHACRSVGTHHGDLHEGNILIEDPDPRQIGCPRTIWVSDFGYGGSHNKIEPKPDHRQLFSIIANLLRLLDPADLNPRDKVMHAKVTQFLHKRLMESDPMQGSHVGNAELLLKSFEEFAAEAVRESAAATKGTELKEPGDYLWAEALAYRAEEWQALFVPEFLGARDLLSKNITVLTGARGCGKTMAFRRLTVFMDKVVGNSSGVEGADQFAGFYLNCRDFAEAFPWLPNRINECGIKQIIHYFHLSWINEILKTVATYDPNQTEGFGWLNGFLIGLFPQTYNLLPLGANVLAHARAFVEQEKERCRLAKFGSEQEDSWALSRLDILDLVQSLLEAHVPWIGDKPLYFFLDDYTIPIVPSEVQRALNPIVFKRRSKLFFKVSTEAANSFDLRGFRGKPLQVSQDFHLIDLATESLHQEERAKSELLDKIFRPRIDRHAEFRGKNLGLKDVLGRTPLSNNKLAKLMRDNAQSHIPKQRIVYHGSDVFTGMWSSDIRTMIQIFTDILREAGSTPSKLNLPIPAAIQDKVYKTKGGEFLVFADSISDPSQWEKGPWSTKPGESYGSHLINIVEAFINVSRDELTKGRLVTNQGRSNPKQAFRIEIVNQLDLSKDALRYYKGLVRWHIFLQDWRGKSVRGMITPRLYLNRVLIPHANLTFSSHDNILLTSEEFSKLLTEPRIFRSYWAGKKVTKLKKAEKGTKKVDEPTLWDGMPEQDSQS